MRVLVACEYSGTVRDAFAERGHDAWSCDILPSETDGQHVQGDVLEILLDGWDLMIAHPPCTYLCNSGVRWLHERAERWEMMHDAAAFFATLLNAPIPRIAVENPIPHRYAIEGIGDSYTHTFQPYEFGCPEMKRTCIWLRNLPDLAPTGPDVREQARPVCHHASPGPDRGKSRSRFWPEVARAMAEQWGALDAEVRRDDLYGGVSPRQEDNQSEQGDVTDGRR